MMKPELDIARLSHTGLKNENQDALGYELPESVSVSQQKGAVMAIADGVSACREARKASHTAIAGFIQDYYSTPDSWTVRHSAARVLNALNRWLNQQGQRDIREEGSWCTTFTSIIIKSNTAHIIHSGDSRAWLFRQGQLECLTRDHTSHMGGRHFLAKALGFSPDIEIDYRTITLEEGDTLLLTTDGIHDSLSEAAISKPVRSGQHLLTVCEELIETALNQGSTDNLSCLLCRVLSLPEAEKEENLQRLAELKFPPDLYPGQILDGYQILEQLHASRRSQLYLARDTDTNRQLIIKTPSVNFHDDIEYLEGFIREEWIGRRISHPAVMRVYPPKSERKLLYHTCEWINGQTLREWMQDHPTPSLIEVRNIIRQIISAVRGLHRMQILHQDLKPDNLMIDQNNRIKLIDFGSARIAGEKTNSEVLHPLGSKNYVAPEYFLGGTIDERADQFAIGVIAYEMFTGQLPYKEQSGNSLRVRHYQHLRYHCAKQLPDWVNGALAKALAADPQKRYPAMSEFLHDLCHPNQNFIEKNSQPLLDKNPVLFWQSLCACLFAYLLWLSFG